MTPVPLTVDTPEFDDLRVHTIHRWSDITVGIDHLREKEGCCDEAALKTSRCSIDQSDWYLQMHRCQIVELYARQAEMEEQKERVKAPPSQ